MAEPTARGFTYKDEQRTYEARQALWIRYEDEWGHTTERVVEMYCPGEREVILTWCRLAQDPCAFARGNIRKWRLLNERYFLDPYIAQYWHEQPRSARRPAS